MVKCYLEGNCSNQNINTYKMEKLILIALAVVGTALAGPSDPEPRPDPNWLARHDGFVERSKNNPGIPIVFYGDSITDGWAGNGAAIWNSVFAPRGAVNYGIGGDAVQHVLWRMMNGELDGLNPKLLVLKIGTNNGDSAQAISEGIRTIISFLRTKIPNTRILLLSVLPRTGEGNYLKIATLNIFISKLHDGNNVYYQNLFDHFGETWGTVSTTYFNDGLHLTTQGYQLWYDIMSPWFFALCECA